MNFVDPLGLINPLKTGVGFVNSVMGIKNMAAGAVAVSTGEATIPFTGGISGSVGFIIGGAQMALGISNFKRGLQQIHEALYESADQATYKNLLGLAPFGQKFDDPCEP